MRGIVIAALIVAGAGPVAAQMATQRPVIRALPKGLATPVPLLKPKVRVEIHHFPGWAMTLPRWPNGWSLPNSTDEDRRNYAMSVARARAAISATCEVSEYDTLDLSAARRRGFRLVGYSAESKLGVPASQERPVLEAVALDSSGNPTMDLPAATTIRIRAPIVALPTPYGQRSCKSYYALSMTMEGPEGIRPFPAERPGAN